MSSNQPGLTPTSFIVLGLVERAGRSTPYELKQAAQATLGNFWSVPHSQVYAEPDRLARAGLLREEREPGGRRRRVFELTDAGRAALAAWRAAPTDQLPELRDPGLLLLAFGADPVAVARARLPAHEAKLAEYEARRAELADAGADAPERRTAALTLEAGIAHERVWVEYWRRLAGDRSR